MNNDAYPKDSVSTAKVIMDLANFIAFFLASGLSVERLVYLQGHKKEMKVKLQKSFKDFFLEMDEFRNIRTDWEAYYLKAFKWKVDLSQVFVPPKPEGGWGDWRLIFVAKNLTCDKVFAALPFPKWRYDEGKIDDLVNIRTPTEHYAVWVRGDVEPDADLIGKSTEKGDPDMKIGITLLERLLFEGKYFDETGKHLDLESVTLCSGSRSGKVDCFFQVNGPRKEISQSVPAVDFYTGNGELRVRLLDLSDSPGRGGLRRVVSS